MKSIKSTRAIKRTRKVRPRHNAMHAQCLIVCQSLVVYLLKNVYFVQDGRALTVHWWTCVLALRVNTVPIATMIATLTSAHAQHNSPVSIHFVYTLQFIPNAV